MKKRSLVALVGAVVLSLSLGASQALAFHCYVENKPDGAGAASFEDAKLTGNGEKIVLPGAFINVSEFGGPDQDVFRRGQPVDVGEPIVGLGSLPSQPHENGGSDGVQSLP